MQINHNFRKRQGPHLYFYSDLLLLNIFFPVDVALSQGGLTCALKGLFYNILHYFFFYVIIMAFILVTNIISCTALKPV